MALIQIDPHASSSLVEQIVVGFRNLVDRGVLHQGMKAPSIRLFATQHQISAHTVSEAYERLLAFGYLESRPRTGFFIRRPHVPNIVGRSASAFDLAFDHLWQVRSHLTDMDGILNVSTGRLPPDWMDTEVIRSSLKSLAAKTDSSLNHYGDPWGYLPLRLLLQNRLADLGIHPEAEQILTTTGASQASEQHQCFIRKVAISRITSAALP